MTIKNSGLLESKKRASRVHPMYSQSGRIDGRAAVEGHMVTSVEAVERFVRRRGAVLTVEPDAKVVSAAKKMRDNQIGCLIVVGADGKWRASSANGTSWPR